MWLSPTKNSDTKAQESSLVGYTLCVSHTLLLGELSALCVAPVGEDNWKHILGLSWTLSYVPFSFVDVNLYAFIGINHNHAYNSFLSSGSSFSRTLKFEGAFGDF